MTSPTWPEHIRQFWGDEYFNNTRYVVSNGAQLLLMHVEVTQLSRSGSFTNDFGAVSDCIEGQKVLNLRIHLETWDESCCDARRRTPV
jgi:hypothetical protein